VRSPSAPSRAPFPYEHRLPSWVEKLIIDRRKSRKPRNAELACAKRDLGLTSTDIDVLRRMLKWRTIYPDSCWVARETVALQLGLSEKTITRAWYRLERAELLCPEQYGERGDPDPRQPENTTGWRYFFPFIRKRSREGRGPDRRPNHDRWQRRGDILSPVGGDILSPNRVLSNPGKSKATTDDTHARASEAGDPESSSSFPPPPSQTLRIYPATVETEAAAADLAELVKIAESIFHQPMRRKVELLVQDFGPKIAAAALHEAEKRPRKKPGNKPVESWGWVINTGKNMLAEQEPEAPAAQIDPKSPPEPPPAANPEPEPRWTPADFPADLVNLSRAELDARILNCQATIDSAGPGQIVWQARMELRQCRGIVENRPCEP